MFTWSRSPFEVSLAAAALVQSGSDGLASEESEGAPRSLTTAGLGIFPRGSAVDSRSAEASGVCLGGSVVSSRSRTLRSLDSISMSVPIEVATSARALRGSTIWYCVSCRCGGLRLELRVWSSQANAVRVTLGNNVGKMSRASFTNCFCQFRYLGALALVQAPHHPWAPSFRLCMNTGSPATSARCGFRRRPWAAVVIARRSSATTHPWAAAVRVASLRRISWLASNAIVLGSMKSS